MVSFQNYTKSTPINGNNLAYKPIKLVTDIKTVLIIEIRNFIQFVTYKDRIIFP